jgi:hypothetical protein
MEAVGSKAKVRKERADRVSPVFPGTT